MISSSSSFFDPSIELLTPTLGAVVTHDLRDVSARAIAGIKRLLCVHADANSVEVFGEGWHTDQSAQRVPPSLSTLYVIEAPAVGGDTLWASMYRAYETLSAPMQNFLCGLTAFHNGSKPAEGYVMVPLSLSAMLHNEHPVVIRHPESGRPSLYVNRATTTHIPQLNWKESEALLALLFNHMEQAQLQCRFRWTPHTVALWDNRCTQHTAIWDYFPNVRRALRATIEGKPLVAADPARAVNEGGGLSLEHRGLHSDFVRHGRQNGTQPAEA